MQKGGIGKNKKRKKENLDKKKKSKKRKRAVSIIKKNDRCLWAFGICEGESFY